MRSLAQEWVIGVTWTCLTGLNQELLCRKTTAVLITKLLVICPFDWPSSLLGIICNRRQNGLWTFEMHRGTKSCILRLEFQLIFVLFWLQIWHQYVDIEVMVWWKVMWLHMYSKWWSWPTYVCVRSNRSMTYLHALTVTYVYRAKGWLFDMN